MLSAGGTGAPVLSAGGTPPGVELSPGWQVSQGGGLPPGAVVDWAGGLVAPGPVVSQGVVSPGWVSPGLVVVGAPVG